MNGNQNKDHHLKYSWPASVPIPSAVVLLFYGLSAERVRPRGNAKKALYRFHFSIGVTTFHLKWCWPLSMEFMEMKTLILIFQTEEIWFLDFINVCAVKIFECHALLPNFFIRLRTLKCAA